MKKIALKIAILIALFAAVPMSFAQSERNRGAGPIIQNLRQVDQQALLALPRIGPDGNCLVCVNVVLTNVNVQALNNIAVVVDLTNVLREARIIDSNQIVVGVNVLGDQTIISVYEF
jgi:hypothetical protein